MLIEIVGVMHMHLALKISRCSNAFVSLHEIPNNVTFSHILKYICRLRTQFVKYDTVNYEYVN